MHNRKPISSFSRRLPVGTNMLARKRMWAVFHTGANCPWRKSARASLLCQEAGVWAMAELGGSVQLGALRACRRMPRFTRIGL
jgi:hypothetical protein